MSYRTIEQLDQRVHRPQVRKLELEAVPEAAAGWGDRRHPLRARPAGLAQREAVALHVLADARIGERGGRVDDAADHGLDRDVLRDQAAGVDGLQAGARQRALVALEVPPGD